MNAAIPRAATVPEWVARWFDELQSLSVASLVEDPRTTAVFSTDMVVGFCEEGALSSERVGALRQPVRDLFLICYEFGVRDFVLLQDTHHPQTPEFEAWPVHCVANTKESQTVDALSSLPFADQFTLFEKNSLAPYQNTAFDAWLDKHPDLRTAIVAGNCTDLCVYQLAMHLRTRANAMNIHGFQVVVPVNCVDTYDRPADLASVSGAYAHPGEFYHQVFLYHMGLNGIRVVTEISA